MNDNFVMRVDGIAVWCYRIAILVAYLGSLNPSFLWGIGSTLIILPSVILIAFVFLLYPKFFHFYRKILVPLFFLLLYLFFDFLHNDLNFNGLIYKFCVFFVFIAIFAVTDDEKKRNIDLISKFMGVLLSFSIMWYILYLLGFSLPHYTVTFNDGQYNYENYFLFLLDDRSALIDIPRFHSIFLEPAHIGVTSVMLLIAQSFDLKKWYNIILLITIILTFSLAAYLLLLLGFFFNKVLYKNFFIYSSIVVFLIIGLYFTAISYNNGDNMLNNLIFERLILEDGKLSGDNRVGDQFLSEYESFLKTDKIYFGKSNVNILEQFEGGNAGYRVFIYMNGLFGLFIIFFFYLFTLRGYDIKWSIVLFFLNILIFWKGGTPLWFNLFIPYIGGLAKLTK